MEHGIGIGEAAALLGAFCWAATSLLVRSQTSTLSAVTINVLRSGTGGLVALIVLALVRPASLGDGIQTSALALILLSVLLAPGLGDTLFFESLRLIGIARAMPLASTNPLFAAALAVLLLGESVTPRMAVGIVLVILSVYLIAARAHATGGRVRDAQRGVLLALSAALLWSLGTIAVRPALRDLDLLVANAIRLPATALVIGLYGWRAGRLNARGELKPRAVLTIAATGLITSVSTLLFLTALQLAGAAKTSALSATSPLFTAPLAVLLYHEPVTVRLLLGTVVSVAGIVLVVAG